MSGWSRLNRLKAGLCVASFAALCLQASAQSNRDAITAYNEARRGGSVEQQVKTSLALGKLALANPNAADAPTLAYEATQSLCALNKCAEAKPFADWMAKTGREPEGILAGDQAVLISLAQWSADPRKKTRNVLNDALAKIVSREPSNLSVQAFQALYLYDLSENEWRRANKSAERAAKHFEPVKQIIATQWSDARTSEIIAGFHDRQNEAAVVDMAKLELELHALMTANGDPADQSSWTYNHRNRAAAWRMAMHAFMGSVLTDKRARQFDLKVKGVLGEYGGPEQQAVVAESADLPLCSGRFEMAPSLPYPSGETILGMYGSALMEVSLKDGKVASVVPMAAAPYDEFKQTAAETIRSWTWVSSDPGQGTTCSLDHSKIILPITYPLANPNG